MKYYFFSLIFLFLSGSVSAQSQCCCCDFRSDGQEAFDKGDYQGAIQAWKSAKQCSDHASCTGLDNLIAKARQKIKPVQPATKKPSAQPSHQADDDAWDLVKESTDSKVIRKYLDKYSNGRHAQAARNRITELEKTSEPASVPVASDLVKITGGTFQMGDSYGDGSNDEKPVHTVSVSTFYMGKKEVTFDEYDAYCDATGTTKPDDVNWGRGQRPVINVNWYDAVEYCNWRSRKERLTSVYTIDKTNKDPNNQNTSDTQKWTVSVNWNANGYRLPTEAEWEYAAREGGKKVRFGNGKDTADPSEINFDASAAYKKEYSVVGEYRQKTVPAGSFSPNRLGLYDMSGNVWEWCYDWYDKGYYGQGNGADNPKGATGGKSRCVRGGSWADDPSNCRAAFRVDGDPIVRSLTVGFRVVRH
jgi:formylglycine-generating enzyme required for sulfatase activity